MQDDTLQNQCAPSSDECSGDLHQGMCCLDAFSLSAHIRNGAVGVLATDTLYGLVGTALFPDVVNRIYQLKRRNVHKPLIILVSDVEQMKYFGVELSKDILRAVRTYWPGRYSIVFKTSQPDRFDYLTRGTGTLCFRMPDRADLFELIDLAGPIVAPSANPEGQPPAKTIAEARIYFGEQVDFYCDAGLIDREPSIVVEYNNGEMKVLRD
jgi:L-threonylcarbamoyladenylate synthase